MKKFVSVSLLLIFAILFSSCYSESTTNTGKDDNYMFSLHEEVEFYDNKSKSKLGSITIEDIFILSDEPFSERVKTGEDEDGFAIYTTVNYEGLVQICYSYDSVDSSKSISSSNFRVSDTDGYIAIKDPKNVYSELEYTEKPCVYESFVVAVQNLNDGIVIDIAFISNQEPSAQVVAFYNGTTVNDNFTSENDTTHFDTEVLAENEDKIQTSELSTTEEHKDQNFQKLADTVKTLWIVIIITSIFFSVCVLIIVILAVKLHKANKKLKSIEMQKK